MEKTEDEKSTEEKPIEKKPSDNGESAITGKLDPKNVDDSNESVSTSSVMNMPKSEESPADLYLGLELTGTFYSSPSTGGEAGKGSLMEGTSGLLSVESTISEFSDREELYSSDDMTRKPPVTNSWRQLRHGGGGDVGFVEGHRRHSNIHIRLPGRYYRAFEMILK
ncbi:hypothetical protein EDB80DRAFT_690290 [Ilyonectria destructans]|nr:hypothetical protein EDB80DRAFT_690290 [Ilyonectria destructans]